MTLPPIPTPFRSKKAKILSELSAPAEDYRDKSPKGTIDEGIRDLIDEINDYEGLVTTSSCAGRISVFLEGSHDHTELNGTGQNGDAAPAIKKPAPGGKGGGTWLFTSHEPVHFSGAQSSCTEAFRLGAAEQMLEIDKTDADWLFQARLIRYSFEPMILHIMCASLNHAQPVLSAAINAGFRESGVQSLRNLDDPEACPMVAVRSAGLSLESVIGWAYLTRNPQNGQVTAKNKLLVTEQYLQMLAHLSGERFEANGERIARFRACLKEATAKQKEKEQEEAAWEDVDTRRVRKRAEGLATARMTKHVRAEEL